MRLVKGNFTGESEKGIQTHDVKVNGAVLRMEVYSKGRRSSEKRGKVGGEEKVQPKLCIKNTIRKHVILLHIHAHTPISL